MINFELPPIKSDEEMLMEVLDFGHQNNFRITEHNSNVILQSKTSTFNIKLRKNTSDFHVFGEVFIKNDYLPLIQKYQEYYKGIEPKYIIDVGANIGCATLYFKEHFKNATIIAIEAEKYNYQTLEENIASNSQDNIFLHHNAFWINEDVLMIEENFRDGRDWAFATRPIAEKSSQNVKGLTLNNILQKYHIEHIDILKIDIEGGEKWILEDKDTMHIIQHHVKMLLVEIHQEVIDMNTASNIIKNLGFNIKIENTLIFANKL